MVVRRLVSKKFVRLGVPFVGLIVGGSFGLQYFASLRYEFSKKKSLSEEEASQYGIRMKAEKVTAEGVLEDIQHQDIDQWENIRGPRPWEDSKTVQDQLRAGEKQ